MFEKIFSKLSALADHHQFAITLVVTVSIFMLSWGFEKLLELYFFPKKPLAGYIIAIITGLSFLWITQHCILHVI